MVIKPSSQNLQVLFKCFVLTKIVPIALNAFLQIQVAGPSSGSVQRHWKHSRSSNTTKNRCQNLKSFMQLCITVPKTKIPERASGRSLEHSDSLISEPPLCPELRKESSQVEEGVQKQKKQPPPPNLKGWFPCRRALQLNLCVCFCTWNESSRFHPGP